MQDRRTPQKTLFPGYPSAVGNNGTTRVVFEQAFHPQQASATAALSGANKAFDRAIAQRGGLEGVLENLSVSQRPHAENLLKELREALPAPENLSQEAEQVRIRLATILSRMADKELHALREAGNGVRAIAEEMHAAQCTQLETIITTKGLTAIRNSREVPAGDLETAVSRFKGRLPVTSVNGIHPVSVNGTHATTPNGTAQKPATPPKKLAATTIRAPGAEHTGAAVEPAGTKALAVRPKEIKAIVHVPKATAAQTQTATAGEKTTGVSETASSAAKEEGFLKNLFATVHEKGFFGAIKEHLFTGWKTNKGETAARTVGVVAGVALMANAALKSETVDEDGKPQPVSWVSRVAKGAAGAGIATASAIVGNR